jgi:MoxR-like ATPase
MENAKRVKATKPGAEPDLVPYKTELIQFRMVQGHEEMRSAELIGDVDLVYDEKGNRHVSYRMGAGLEAAVEGYTLLVDEFDACPAGVLSQAHGLFDRRVKDMHFWLNGQQTFIKHDRFRFIFSGNTRGAGENVSEYAHAQIQSRAFLNRMAFVVEVGYMEAFAEIALIHNRVPAIPKMVLTKMVDAANNIRVLYTSGSVDVIVSTRDLESWARQSVRFAKSSGGAYTDNDYWNRFVPKAAACTFLGKTADMSSAEAASRELSWR